MKGRGFGASAAGKPAPVFALAHIRPFRTVRQHLAKLGAAQAIAAVTGKAFVLGEGRLVWLGLRGLDDEPVFSSLVWPIARLRLEAVAMGEQPGRDFPGCRKGRVWRCHKYAVLCRLCLTVRPSEGISTELP